MSFQNDRYEIRLATEEDREDLLALFENSDFKGKISVLFTRRPNPYLSLQKEGEKAVIAVLRDRKEERICAVGCCILRKVFINGEVKKAGYWTSLKVLPDHQRCLPYMPEVYRFLHEQTKEDADLYYTTILEDNFPARKLLEKKHRNMPEYSFVGGYTVYCLGPQRGSERNSWIFQKGNSSGVDDFYEAHLRSFNFSPADRMLSCMSNDDFYTLRDQKGEILAACALWNQQSYKQYVIKGYKGLYRHLRRLPLKLLGYPGFPRENTSADYASIALLCFKDNDLSAAEYLIKKVSKASCDYDFILLGLHESHPLNAIFEDIKHIKYQSRLYTVQWDEEPYKLDQRPIDLEVGLL